MRLLVVGSDKVFAIENFYAKYLRELGVEVKQFNAQSYFFDYYKGIINKVIFKAGLSGIYGRIDRLFREVVGSFNPDIIWVFKGMEISPDALRWAKSKGIKLVSYNPDNPFIFTGSGSGNKNVSGSIGLFDLHFTYNREIQKQLERDFGSKTSYLPFGFDVDDRVYEFAKSHSEIVKLCFLGNPDKQRALFINELAKRGVELDVYGNDWDKFVAHSNITVFGPVYGDDLWVLLRRYRMQLNLMRIHNLNSHNMRTFEVPGIGGILLTPETTEQIEFFVNGKELFFYRDVEESVAIINKVMTLEKTAADEVRENARMRSLESGYSYRKRAEMALIQLKSVYE